MTQIPSRYSRDLAFKSQQACSQNKMYNGFNHVLNLHGALQIMKPLRFTADGDRFDSQWFKSNRHSGTTFDIVKSYLYAPISVCWQSALLRNRKFDMDRHAMLSFN